MKKKTLINTIFAVCAAVLLAAVILGVSRIRAFAGYHYEHASEYAAGETELPDKVKNLDIDWVSGAVRIVYYDGNSILIDEKSEKKISDDMQLRWWLDGDTLRIRYAKNGYRTFHLFSSQKKELILTLPEEIVLNDVTIDATSGVLDIPALKAETLSLDVTSGDITAAAAASDVTIGATSGNISFTAEKDAEKISASVTSGNIAITAENVDQLDAETTSGRIDAAAREVGKLKASCTSGGIAVKTGSVRDADVNTTSGDIRFESSGVEKLKIDATSGDIQLLLPEDSGFTADLDTSSGHIDYELPLQKKDGVYVYGDGKGSLEIETTSGNIMISSLGE